MKQTAAPVLALLLAGCAAARPEATLTFSGSEPRVETWTPVVVERGHLHADLTDYPCPMSDVLQMTDAMKTLAGPRAATGSEQMGLILGGMMDKNCARQYGPAYGGPEHLVLGLIRRGGEPEKPQEAILLDFPRLKADETERRFEKGSFAAAWERPPKKVLATLVGGWVRVRRLGPSRYDFEIFLILAPVEAGGPSTQVVSRVQAAAAPQ